MASIYNDRLMPATYLYEISKNLYEKKLLHSGNTELNSSELNVRITTHNAAIAKLVKDYELTELTPEENLQWQAFKMHLLAYNTAEEVWLNNASPLEQNSHTALEKQFAIVQQHLNTLSSIQVGEGSNLQKSSHSIISSTLLLSYLEISLLVVLGLFTLVLLSTSDKSVFRQQPHSQSLN